jgi:hypothetical protein
VPVLFAAALACGLASPARAQSDAQQRLPGITQQEPDQRRLPDGRLQRDEMLKADHMANIRDMAEIEKMAAEIRAELEKNDRHVLSVLHLKKLEEIQKLSKRVRDRMRRF